MCNQGPARVFKPNVALCGRCNAELDRMEQLDNAIDNPGPPCVGCGELHSGHACMQRGVLLVGAE